MSANYQLWLLPDAGGLCSDARQHDKQKEKASCGMPPDHNAIRVITDSLMRLATVERLRREADVLSAVYLANGDDWPETLKDYKTAVLTAIKELEEGQA